MTEKIWCKFERGARKNDIIARAIEGERSGKLVLPAGNPFRKTYLDKYGLIDIKSEAEKRVIGKLAYLGGSGEPCLFDVKKLDDAKAAFAALVATLPV